MNIMKSETMCVFLCNGKTDNHKTLFFWIIEKIKTEFEK